MSPEVTVDADGTVTGNTYDKYNTTNPVAKRLQAGFERNLAELLAKADPSTLLDVGCGEGVLTYEWAQRPSMQRIVGIDLPDASVQKHWDDRQAPNLEYRLLKLTEQNEPLPFADSEFEAATAIEVLEHVPDPEFTAAEMARCASKWVLVSVPREPIWRVTNMARGAYWGQLGNSPGHLNHWSKSAFKKLWEQHGDIVEARSPFPWTMLLVDVSK
ncbi:MAG TPA: class I SAM-dependent methyltransferase [Baekduia sp.]|nr:class I SAM-dependent methyltransferase [Baekduia sp.]